MKNCQKCQDSEKIARIEHTAESLEAAWQFSILAIPAILATFSLSH
jgi:hypothetical protein